jgi:hypothetical protein
VLALRLDSFGDPGDETAAISATTTSPPAFPKRRYRPHGMRLTVD